MRHLLRGLLGAGLFYVIQLIIFYFRGDRFLNEDEAKYFIPLWCIMTGAIFYYSSYQHSKTKRYIFSLNEPKDILKKKWREYKILIIARYLNLAFKICLVGIPVAFLDYFLADGAHLGTDEVMLAVFIITGTLSLLISYRLKKRYTD